MKNGKRERKPTGYRMGATPWQSSNSEPWHSSHPGWGRWDGGARSAGRGKDLRKVYCSECDGYLFAHRMAAKQGICKCGAVLVDPWMGKRSRDHEQSRSVGPSGSSLLQLMLAYQGAETESPKFKELVDFF